MASRSSASSYSSPTRSTSGPSSGWRLVAVRRGVEVRAAAEQQAVEAVEQRRDVVDVAVGGEHDRDRPRLLQRLRVAQPQRQARRVAVALGAARRGAHAAPARRAARA